MSNTDFAGAPIVEAAPSSIRQIAVTKAKSTVSIDTARIDESYYAHALDLGLKTLVNGGATKIVADGYATEDEFHAAALAKANERVEAMYANKLVIRGLAKKKEEGKYDAKTTTEARRIARDLVKKSMKERKIKISGYSAAEITQTANALMADAEVGPGIYAQAERNLAARSSDVASAGALADKIVLGLHAPTVKEVKPASTTAH